jgi:hypothetical protein
MLMEKLSKEKRKAVIKALTKTLNAYEELIQNTKENVDKWVNFGSTHTCRVCVAMEYKPNGDYKKHCYGCPLLCNFTGDDIIPGAPCVNQSFVDFETAIHDYCWKKMNLNDSKIIKQSLKIVKSTAKIRYKWIVQQLDILGYEFK